MAATEGLTEGFRAAKDRDARPLLERDGELAELDALLTDAHGGRGRTLIVRGPAGIGKTRLLQAVRGRASALGFVVLSARGGELERDFAFGVARQLLEPALARAQPAERWELLAGAPRLAEPVLAEAPVHDETGDPTHGVLHGLYWLVANLAERASLLVTVDDLHCADGPSLRFLAYLARRLEGLPVAVVLATRSGQQDGTQQELLRVLELEAAARVIRPAPLSEPAVADLVEVRLGERLGAELAEACHDATGGNPFLLGELLEDLRQSGRPAAELRPEAVRRLAPERIAAAVLMRIGRRDPRAPALARAIAVLGDGARLGRAAALAGIDQANARTLADSLADATVLERGELRFVHPIVRAAVYEDIPAGQRAALHTRAARLFADEGAGQELVAVHLLATDPRASDEVVDALSEAAEAALSRGAPETAARYLTRALDEPPSERRRAGVLHALGSAEILSGDSGGLDRLEQAVTVATEARERALIARSLAHMLGPQFAETVATLEAAIAELPETERELRLELEALAATVGRHAPSTYARSAARLVRVAGGIAGTTPAERLLLANLAFQRAIEGGTAREAAALAERALEGDLPTEHGAVRPSVWDAVYTLVLADEFTLAERFSDAALAEARARGSLPGAVLSSIFRSLIACRRGHMAKAEREAWAALDILRTTRSAVAFVPAGTACVIDALIERGQLATAAQALADCDAAETIPDAFLFNYLLLTRARLRLASGDARRGVADLRLLARREAARHGSNPSSFPWRSILAVALERLGDHAEARRLAAEELGLARTWGTPRAIGMALRASGLVEGSRRGIDLLAEAVATLERSENRLEHARALVDLGAALRRAGRRTDAKERLAAGMDLAHRCGAGALVETAHAELRLAGARPRRITQTGVDALTASEHRVAELAAQGMTNKEIAQALFVTLRTVEMHLSKAYAKLGITSRRELANAL